MPITHETIDRSCESVPFVVISIPKGNIRLWWTKNKGAYGRQVYLFSYAGDKGDNATLFLKTNGYTCGKETSVLEKVFQWLGKKPVGFGLGVQGAPDGLQRWHLGGNFYQIENPNDWEVIQ